MNRQLHYKITEARPGTGINLITGEMGAKLFPFTQYLTKIQSGFYVYCHPEGQNTSRWIRLLFEKIAKRTDHRIEYIITHSLFVMREAHMLQKEHGYPVRWFYVKADGSFYQADSMDDIRECESLDEEIRQAERYINLENGLTPRKS